MPEYEIIVSERFNDAGDRDGYRWRIGYETGVTDEAGYQAIEAAVRKAIGPPLPETERWMVVDKNRTPIIPGLHRRENAESEAKRLNEEGLADFAPYRVVPDVVATDLNTTT